MKPTTALIFGPDMPLTAAITQRLESADFAVEPWSDKPRDAEFRVEVFVFCLGSLEEDPSVEKINDFHARVEANVGAPFRIVRDLSGRMRSDGTGRVIFVLDAKALNGEVDHLASSSSQSAALGLCRALGHDLARHDVAVMAIVNGGHNLETVASLTEWLAGPAGSAAHGKVFPLS